MLLKSIKKASIKTETRECAEFVEGVVQWSRKRKDYEGRWATKKAEARSQKVFNLWIWNHILKILEIFKAFLNSQTI